MFSFLSVARAAKQSVSVLGRLLSERTPWVLCYFYGSIAKCPLLTPHCLLLFTMEKPELDVYYSDMCRVRCQTAFLKS